jgi:eukaryotic-like serine/threonine-protein kinase
MVSWGARMAPPADDSKQDELEKTIARLVETHAAHHDSFVMAPGKTIEPGRAATAPETISARRSMPARPALELGKTLGQGGMGVVRQARQVALDRDVAVKSIQPKLASDAATRMMLQEALILGRLEHPNILPIYDVRHDGGEPQIVLKKIEGIEWSALMHRPDLIRDELGATDALDWNLGILMQVCNAIHFAHSRGFIHRDLKPDNVMIGEFGEVYVMDWGLALCLEDDGTGRFPLAKDAKELAGTPQYMAPEMLGGAQVRISARTDVYLLGAMLYEIIDGRPPHRGKDMQAMIGQVVLSRPSLPADCPSELARICRMAMDPEPGWRFESVEALRLALQGFVQHAGSRRLATQALARTEEFLSLIAKREANASEAAERIQSLFIECRFAFRQALELWPENDQAMAGLDRAVHAMIEYELAQHNPRGAAALLGAIESVDPALKARVEDAMRALSSTEQRMADLERLSKQFDVETGGMNRAFGAGVLGIVWTVAPIVAPTVWAMFPAGSRLPAVAFLTGVLVAIGIWAVAAHEEIRESNVTRWLMRGAAVAMVGTLLLELVGYVLGMDPARIEAMWPLVWFCVSSMLVVQVDWRLLPMTLAFLATLLVSVTWPQYRFYAMAASNLVMTINMFSIWMPWRSALAQLRAWKRRS